MVWFALMAWPPRRQLVLDMLARSCPSRHRNSHDVL